MGQSSRQNGASTGSEAGNGTTTDGAEDLTTRSFIDEHGDITVVAKRPGSSSNNGIDPFLAFAGRSLAAEVAGSSRRDAHINRALELSSGAASARLARQVSIRNAALDGLDRGIVAAQGRTDFASGIDLSDPRQLADAVASSTSGVFGGNVVHAGNETLLAAVTALGKGVRDELPGFSHVNAFNDARQALENGDVFGATISLSGAIPGLPAFGRVDPNTNRGLEFVTENLGAPRNGDIQFARNFESATSGAFSDIATRQRVVPALRFDNPNVNGAEFVRFDGFRELDNGVVELIDSKTRVVPFATKNGPFISDSVRDGLRRQSEALSQNPNFRGVIELPNVEARIEAVEVLTELGISNISTRVR